MNAPPTIELDDDTTNPLEIARRELEARTLPLLIRRAYPDGSYEEWHVSELVTVIQ